MSLISNSMQTFASVERTTPKGHHSVWHFVCAQDGYYAFGGCHKPLIKRFDTIDELRALYREYIGYGYAPIAQQLELAV